MCSIERTVLHTLLGLQGTKQRWWKWDTGYNENGSEEYEHCTLTYTSTVSGDARSLPPGSHVSKKKLKYVTEGECKRQEYSPDIRRRYERCDALHNHQLVSVLVQLCKRNSRELFVKTWIKDNVWCNLIVANFKAFHDTKLMSELL